MRRRRAAGGGREGKKSCNFHSDANEKDWTTRLKKSKTKPQCVILPARPPALLPLYSGKEKIRNSAETIHARENFQKGTAIRRLSHVGSGQKGGKNY